MPYVVKIISVAEGVFQHGPDSKDRRVVLSAKETASYEFNTIEELRAKLLELNTDHPDQLPPFQYIQSDSPKTLDKRDYLRVPLDEVATYIVIAGETDEVRFYTALDVPRILWPQHIIQNPPNSRPPAGLLRTRGPKEHFNWLKFFTHPGTKNILTG